jgi:hypothetical protein
MIQNILAPVLMVVGVILLGFILVGSVRGKVARRQAATPSPREQIERVKGLAGGQENVYAANAELLETAQRLAGQLDAKAERLQQLMNEAERRVAALRAVLEETDASSAGSSAGGSSAGGSSSGGGAAEMFAGEPLGRIGPSSASASASAVPADPLTTTVYELADAGHDPVQIAQQLDEQVGKVELILALRGDDR